MAGATFPPRCSFAFLGQSLLPPYSGRDGARDGLRARLNRCGQSGRSDLNPQARVWSAASVSEDLLPPTRGSRVCAETFLTLLSNKQNNEMGGEDLNWLFPELLLQTKQSVSL